MLKFYVILCELKKNSVKQKDELFDNLHQALTWQHILFKQAISIK